MLHSVKAFTSCPSIAGLVIVTNATKVRFVQHLVSESAAAKPLQVIVGGKDRSESVRNGLAALPDRGIVAVHDAARPLITPTMLTAGIRACRRCRAVTYGYPVTDTLKRTAGQTIITTVERHSLIAVQTPQFFDIELLRKAHERFSTAPVTDDCALVERLGIRPHWLSGPRTNIKVTYPEDLILCQALLCGVSA